MGLPNARPLQPSQLSLPERAGFDMPHALPFDTVVFGVERGS
jgi:hypothetical protein